MHITGYAKLNKHDGQKAIAKMKPLTIGTNIHEMFLMDTFGKYSVTIIIGLLCVTAPRNWTTLGCLILRSNESSSLNALLQKPNELENSE